MKKLMFISGAISFAVVPLAVLCKIVHVPGANLLFILGIGLFSLVFVPLYAKYRYDRAK
jgi:hypothetical protein